MENEKTRHDRRRISDLQTHIVIVAAILTILLNIGVMANLWVKLESRLTKLETVQEIILRRTGVFDQREKR